MDVLVTYDIRTPDRAGERRLLEVARICQQYGRRVQYSVFECRLTETGLERLLDDLDSVVTAVDTIHVYRFHGALSSARITLGQQKRRELDDPWIL